MKNTQFKVEDIFVCIISEYSISPEQLPKSIEFSAKNTLKINKNIKPNIFKPKNEKIIKI